MEFIRRHSRGLYVALAFCLVAAGVVGYMALTREEPAEPASRSGEIIEVQPPAAAATATPTKPKPVQEQPQTAAPVESVSELLPRIVSPLDGTTVTVFSMNDLLYDETMADWRTHDGLDIQAGEGDAVKTAASGTVRTVLNDELMGTIVSIDHEGGYTTSYASLQKDPPVAEGQALSAGDIIGYVGTAAAESSVGPHVHFSVTKDGAPIDPAEYVK